MKNSKIFRLFVSSTFNDFREERKVLQTKIFPAIKEFCSEKGYRFQPIDLRWGISNEAQLDQKTLELCLNEVKTCKSYPYPNFLVMLGDRYGWIPLPYIIEQTEFEEILNFANNNEKLLLKEWYQLDKNQLPPSFVLKQREGTFKSIDKWTNVENSLLNIFQSCVNKSSLTVEQKRKYFTSATEAEIEEGIIPYLKPTSFQNKLLKENPNLESIDTKYIFGFLRHIDIKSKMSEKFITKDYKQAQILKANVKETLLNDNIIESYTTQLDKETLNLEYLIDFENQILKFLKGKLDEQIQKEKNFSELEIELQEQSYFAEQKRKDFIGQEMLLRKIEDYISNNNNQPLVIYGKSGSGKSSLMAQAINTTNTESKVIYRFIGATSNTNSTRNLWVSIFDELGINIRAKKKTDILLNPRDTETFPEFSKRIKNKLSNIQNRIVIFIDAIDQLTNEDTFIWLPEILNKNIKIIISTLEDVNYKKDNKYFYNLKKITSNTLQVTKFEHPIILLKKILKKWNRQIQKHQIDYFLHQYKNSKTPLYIYVAAQEIKHWKSFELTENQVPIKKNIIQDLSNSQKGIIEEFIKNLSDFYHHNKYFVQKILTYIYASTEGISESEILELLDSDKEFIQKIAPETWHINSSKEFPLVLWTRLYKQIKPFLSIKRQDNEELLFFFHREFLDIISIKEWQNKEFESMIKNVQTVLLKYQKGNDHFYDNRWGKLYINLIKNHYLKYNDYLKLDKNIDFLVYLRNEFWITEMWKFLYNEGLKPFDNELEKKTIIEISYFLADKAYNKPIKYSFVKKDNILIISSTVGYKLNIELPKNLDNSIFKEIIEDIKPRLPKKRKDIWTYSLIISTAIYANYLRNIGSQKESLNLLDKNINTTRILYEIENTEGKVSFAGTNHKGGWTHYFIGNLIDLSTTYNSLGKFKVALVNITEAYDIVLEKWKDNPDNWRVDYIDTLNTYSTILFSLGDIGKAIQIEQKAIIEIGKLYKNNFINISTMHFDCFNNLISYYISINNENQAIVFANNFLDLSKKLYELNPKVWKRTILYYWRLLKMLSK